MKRMQTFLAPLALAGVCAFTTNATSQEPSQETPQSSSTTTARTGDGLLSLQADMPQQTHAGESFEYTVTVSNSSDNMTLHDVVLKHRKAEGLTVESVSKQSNATNSSQSEENGSDEQEKSGDQSQKAKESQNGKNNKPKQLKISALKPGESQTFVVKATADKEGDLKSCLEIASYTPAVCLTTTVVKPELELTKKAPKTADRCNVIEIVYSIKNGGSGDVGAMTISDKLGNGLETIDGENSLKFVVDGLSAGDTRSFKARVFATKAGSFSSRATAKATDSDLQSRSKKTTTKVSAADLAVRINGPKKIQGEKTAQFTATVRNTGNVDATDVDVTVMWPEQASLANLGDVSKKKASKQGDESKSDQQQPTLAKSGDGNSAGDSDKQGSNEGDNSKSNATKMAKQSFTIDSLAAGETAQFQYTVQPNDVEKLATKVEALYICDVDAATDREQASAKTTAVAMASVEVVRLPALQIMIIDSDDPVANGDEVTYTARVWNEGDAADSNVQLEMEIPDGLEFVSANGPTEFNQDGGVVTFDAIKSMKAGQREDYKLVAKASGSGSVKVKANLSSKTLDESVSSEEPTELFSEGSDE
ncbi:DUF11 domain-containing protein [Allorhodopirellula solitaria]|uniref:Large cysteine-rich periplasmic protein omcB n=1 Tax=Allorhodopirellula solitaria TaxID=2527987 RepID=A0A5C5YGH1_9BACT|nr:DUF11 domain-containing protein [Allorhodopirellula solitaria]TWT74248.1 Large cysteine-rich periplasmic protein omcB precursor [Allorhodopirellula solitaria]